MSVSEQIRTYEAKARQVSSEVQRILLRGERLKRRQNEELRSLATRQKRFEGFVAQMRSAGELPKRGELSQIKNIMHNHAAGSRQVQEAKQELSRTQGVLSQIDERLVSEMVRFRNKGKQLSLLEKRVSLSAQQVKQKQELSRWEASLEVWQAKLVDIKQQEVASPAFGETAVGEVTGLMERSEDLRQDTLAPDGPSATAVDSGPVPDSIDAAQLGDSEASGPDAEKPFGSSSDRSDRHQVEVETVEVSTTRSEPEIIGHSAQPGIQEQLGSEQSWGHQESHPQAEEGEFPQRTRSAGGSHSSDRYTQGAEGSEQLIEDLHTWSAEFASGLTLTYNSGIGDRIQMSVRQESDNTVQVELIAESSQEEALLRNRRDQLLNELQRAGLQITNLDIRYKPSTDQYTNRRHNAEHSTQ